MSENFFRRIEPTVAGSDAQKLPLCYAAPFSFLHKNRSMDKLGVSGRLWKNLRSQHSSSAHLFSGGYVLGQLDLGEVTLAYRLEEPVLADVRLLARFPG